jgi:hypothetical protein
MYCCYSCCAQPPDDAVMKEEIIQYGLGQQRSTGAELDRSTPLKQMLGVGK